MTRTRRRPYRKSRAISRQCRCSGSCPWCHGSRTYNNRRRLAAAVEAVREYWLTGE